MSVISTYTARVTISVFITIIALLPNTSNGQSSHEQNYFYYHQRMEKISSDSSSSKNEGDSSSSIFPKNHVPDIEDTSQSDAKKIPMEFFEQLNNVTDFDEFIQKFIDEDDDGLKNYQSSFLERSAGRIAKVANCEPTLQVVPLEPYGSPSLEPDVFYYPKCTRIKKCNGCCNSPALVCTPVETQENSLTILKVRYKSQGSEILAKEPISIQEHIKCECQCKIKQEDCLGHHQTYDSKNCKCLCTNKDEKAKCDDEKDKIWDHRTCKCVCRNDHECTTGSFFSEQTCTCIEERIRPIIGDRKRLIIKATPVVEDNSTLYDTTDN